jgi:hypothetical protein
MDDSLVISRDLLDYAVAVEIDHPVKLESGAEATLFIYFGRVAVEIDHGTTTYQFTEPFPGDATRYRFVLADCHKKGTKKMTTSTSDFLTIPEADFKLLYRKKLLKLKTDRGYDCELYIYGNNNGVNITYGNAKLVYHSPFPLSAKDTYCFNLGPSMTSITDAVTLNQIDVDCLEHYDGTKLFEDIRTHWISDSGHDLYACTLQIDAKDVSGTFGIKKEGKHIYISDTRPTRGSWYFHLADLQLYANGRDQFNLPLDSRMASLRSAALAQGSAMGNVMSDAAEGWVDMSNSYRGGEGYKPRADNKWKEPNQNDDGTIGDTGRFL